jgi:hypothetical protein
MTDQIKPPTSHPCASCPYRRDVPSGVWHPQEYRKLPGYDNDTWAQPAGVFMCHQRNGHICSGWAGCHDMHSSLAVRLAATKRQIATDDVLRLLDYECPVPLWDSGTDAAEHGLADVEDPDDRAVATISKLERRRGGQS